MVLKESLKKYKYIKIICYWNKDENKTIIRASQRTSAKQQWGKEIKIIIKKL